MSFVAERRCLITIVVVACCGATTADLVWQRAAIQDRTSEERGRTEETQIDWALQFNKGPLRHYLSTEHADEDAAFQELSGVEVSRRAEKIAVILIVTVIAALTSVILCCGSRKPEEMGSNHAKAAENQLSFPKYSSQDIHTRRHTTGCVKMMGDHTKWKSADDIPGPFSASFTCQMSLDKIRTAMDVHSLSTSVSSSQSSSDTSS